MKLVIGGAFQGKLSYAKETYQVKDNWIDGRDCGFDEIMTCVGIHHFHEYIRRLLLEEHGLAVDTLADMEQQAESFVEELCRRNPDILIVSNELGYGVVPMEKFERDYRETVGRVCTCAAARCEEVTRVICGVGTRIK